jgi:ribonuclease P protein component
MDDVSHPEPRRDERLGGPQRLKRRGDYLRCYRQGGKIHGALASLHFHPNEEHQARLGITASRKVGKAVVRQRVKRRVREIFRRWPERGHLPGLDVVVHLKPPVGGADFKGLKNEVEDLLAVLLRKRGAKR